MWLNVSKNLENVKIRERSTAACKKLLRSAEDRQNSFKIVKKEPNYNEKQQNVPLH